MLTDGLEWCGLLWCFYQLSFWRHPFTAEHSLLRHWCRDTFLQIWWRNKLIYISEGLRKSQSNTHLPLWSIFFIALSFWMFWGSWSHRCIRMKFSFPFRLSLVQVWVRQQFRHRACVKPKTSSPNTTLTCQNNNNQKQHYYIEVNNSDYTLCGNFNFWYISCHWW